MDCLANKVLYVDLQTFFFLRKDIRQIIFKFRSLELIVINTRI